MKRYPVKRVKNPSGSFAEDYYTYRNIEFYRNQDVPHGIYGRYRIGSKWFGYLSEVKAHIDSLLINVLSEE